MEILEDYLASDYLVEKQEAATINQTLNEVAATFSATTIFSGGMWPYEFRTVGGNATSARVSQGTLAMVLTTTGRLLGHCSMPKGGFADQDIQDAEALEKNWKTALATLLTNLSAGI